MFILKRRFLTIFAGLIVLGVAALGLSLASAQPVDPTLEVLELLNGWRIQQGLWPLKPNDTLQQLALAQAEYLLSLPDMPDGGELHKGRNGEMPPQRAILAPYNWPTYGVDQIAIGEVAAVGSPEYAVEYWQHSDIHARTVVNPAYREVGIAALPHNSDTLFIVVLGGRPNVLPAVVAGDQIYLSNEQYQYAAAKDNIHTVTQFRLFDADGKPLTDDWMAWQSTLPIPANAGDHLFVLYDDGAVQVMSEVSLEGIALEPPQVVEAAQPTAVPTTQPATPQTSSDQPSAPVTSPDVLLIYNNDTLTLLNVSTQNIDLSSLDVEGSGITLATTRWTSVAEVPLNDFPPGHCLMVQASGEDITMPTGCSWLRSVITMSPVQFFWIGSKFDVRAGGQVLATCEPGKPDCGVKLPG